MIKRALDVAVVGERIATYREGTFHAVEVQIIKKPDGEYLYYAIEPVPTPEVEELYKEVMEYIRTHPQLLKQLAERSRMPETVMRTAVDRALEYIGKQDLPAHDYETLVYYVVRDRIGWGPIDVLMKDDRVEEITMVSANKPISVVMKMRDIEAKWVDTNIIMDDKEAIDLIEFLAQKTGKQITISQPILEAKTPEGYRLAANLAEVSTSPSFTIRKFPKTVFSVIHLIEFNSISPLAVAYLWTLMEHKKFVMIVGLMGSGKTTLLQALLSTIPRDMKVLTIEDTPELRLRHPRWQTLYTRPAIFGTEQEITLYDLIRHSLRTRADYIVVGEVRDKEIYPLLQIVGSGYGSACTMHADSPESLFFRLTTPPMNVPPAFMSLVAAVVHTAEVEIPLKGTKGRRVVRIWEITGVKPKATALEVPVRYHTLFEWDETNDVLKPTTVEELIEKSYHLRIIGETVYGKRFWKHLMTYELKYKVSLLEGLRKNGIFEYDKVTEYIYRGRLKMKEKIREYMKKLVKGE